MSDVGATSGYSPTNSTKPSQPADRMNQLGADTFLQLLVTQLRYQDPFSEGGDVGDFNGQVAQFTLLEQVVKLQQSFDDFASSQAPMQALNMLNKQVELIDETGHMVDGQVTAVRMLGGNPLIKVAGKEYPLANILSVKMASGGGEYDE